MQQPSPKTNDKRSSSCAWKEPKNYDTATPWFSVSPNPTNKEDYRMWTFQKKPHLLHLLTGKPSMTPPQLKRLVLKQHQTHFSQANGTTFTIDPLQSLINDKCTSPFAQQVLQGTVDIDSQPIDIHTKMLLKHLKKKTQPNENPTHNIDPEAIIQGFKLWPKWTSTSPSGHHLSIYKSLAKHFPPHQSQSTHSSNTCRPNPKW